jgi:tRNA G10  N-methylase Trm11
MKDIPDESVDMVLCDLPYGTTACKWDMYIPFDKLWEQYNRVIKDNGAIVLFGSEPFSSTLRMSNIKNYKYDWIWLKVELLDSKWQEKTYEGLRGHYGILVKATVYNNTELIKLEKPIILEKNGKGGNGLNEVNNRHK